MTNAVVTVYRTPQFLKAYKKLKKKHRNDVIKDLDQIIGKLIRMEIHKEKSNHTLKNSSLFDIHIRNDVILLYRYTQDNEVLIITLELNNIVNHDELDRKVKLGESNRSTKLPLTEGIWALPFSKNKANKLKELMSNKLEYTEELLDDLYNLTGDDALFDDIESRIDNEEYQGKDARELLKEYLKVILDAYEKEPEAFSDNLDYDAAKILKELIR